MKTRQGFVSNSSSSSFIVAFPKNTQMKDVKKILFGNEEVFGHPYDEKQSFTTQQVAETITRDMAEQVPNDMEAITQAIRNGYFDGYENLPGHTEFDFNATDGLSPEERGEYWRKKAEEDDARANRIAERFISKNANKDIYVLSYADEDGGYFGAIEHGDTFNRVPHIRVSNH